MHNLLFGGSFPPCRPKTLPFVATPIEAFNRLFLKLINNGRSHATVHVLGRQDHFVA
jgi:hypothetical protein